MKNIFNTIGRIVGQSEVLTQNSFNEGPIYPPVPPWEF